MPQPRAKFTCALSDVLHQATVGYVHSLRPDSSNRSDIISTNRQTDRKSSYLLLAVLALDEPGNGSLGRARNALQEGAVVLRGEHRPVVSPIQVFCRREMLLKITTSRQLRSFQMHKPSDWACIASRTP